MTQHFISKACTGEKCRMCGRPATHKVAEEIPHDHPANHPDPLVNARERAVLRMMPGPLRDETHELTAYVCCEHFWRIFGPAVECVNAGTIALGPASDSSAAEFALRKAIRDLPGAVGDLERKQLFDLIEKVVNKAVWSETDLGVDG